MRLCPAVKRRDPQPTHRREWTQGQRSRHEREHSVRCRWWQDGEPTTQMRGDRSQRRGHSRGPRVSCMVACVVATWACTSANLSVHCTVCKKLHPLHRTHGDNAGYCIAGQGRREMGRPSVTDRWGVVHRGAVTGCHAPSLWGPPPGDRCVQPSSPRYLSVPGRSPPGAPGW